MKTILKTLFFALLLLCIPAQFLGDSYPHKNDFGGNPADIQEHLKGILDDIQQRRSQGLPANDFNEDEMKALRDSIGSPLVADDADKCTFLTLDDCRSKCADQNHCQFCMRSLDEGVHYKCLD